MLNLLGRNNCDFNISELESRSLNYSELPFEFKSFLNDPSDFKHFTQNGLSLGAKTKLCLNCEEFEFETVNSFVSSWIDYYKLIDIEKNIIYRIDYGNNFPFVVHNRILYISESPDIFTGRIDIACLRFVAYYLMEMKY